MALSGDAFHRTIISGTRDARGQALSQFKTHVKKDNVDLASVPRYFEALAVTMNLLDPELQTLAFSLVCHLVKRVSIQDKSGKLLPGVSSMVLPIIIPKIADARNPIKISARRALEAYWFSAPEKTESAVAEIGLGSNGLLLANESIVWLNSLLLINTNLDLHSFFHPLALILGKYPNDDKLASNIKILFANYFDLKHNRLHRFELQKILESSNVSAAMRTSIVGTDSLLSRDYEGRRSLSTNSPMSVASPPPPALKIPPPSAPSTTTPSLHSSTLSTQNNLNEIKFIHKPVSPPRRSSSSLDNEERKDNSQELQALLHSLSGHALEKEIKPFYIDSLEELHLTFNSLCPCFDGKENEKNWTHREKAINKVRTLLRGDAYQKFGETLINAVKDLTEPICKGLMSLRTSLCLSACQLVKELAIFLQHDFSTLLDHFWPTLMRLCSSTKHLTSSAAHVVVSTIIAYTLLTTKTAQKIYSSSKEKSANLRAYSAFWLQIYMVRSQKLWLIPPSCEVIEVVLLKLLPDPNAQVRLAAKDAFWRYYILAVDSATNLLSKLDSNTVKALERARPKSCQPAAPLALAGRSRPSLKETIAAKNMELKGRMYTSRSISRSGYRSYLDSNSKSIDISTESDTKMGSINFTGVRDYSATDPSIGGAELKAHPDTSLKKLTPPLKFNNLKTSHDTETNSISVSGSEPRADDDREFILSDILNLLTSKSLKQIEKGIQDLSIIFSRDIAIDSSLQSAISQTLVTHPLMFGTIVSEQRQCKKLLAVVGPNELVRTCFVALDGAAVCFKALTAHLNVDQLTESVNSLLYNICHMDSISDKKQLVMQLIKFKRNILAILMEVLYSAVSTEPISKSNFMAITLTLMSLVPVVYQTEIISPYKDLLKLLYRIDELEFKNQLDQTSLQNQRELCNLIDIESSSKPQLDDAMTLYPSDFTQIAPGSITSGLSPLKHPSDFTMLFPSKQPTSLQLPLQGHSDAAMKVDSIKVEVEKQQINDKETVISKDTFDNFILRDEKNSYDEGSDSNNSDKDVISHRSSEPVGEDSSLSHKELPFHNVFANADIKALSSDFVARLNNDPAGELLEDLAQVKLSNFSNSIESFIQKVDPFNKMSGRSKPIAIFEDPKVCSPQKVKEYSYTKMNWFNFLMARLSVSSEEQKDVNTIDEICRDMKLGELSIEQLAALLKTLQSAQDQGSDHISEENIQIIEHSLWTYLKFPNSDRLLGLMLMKQLLVLHHPIKLEILWLVLVSICANNNPNVEQYVIELAVKEVVEEMLCGLYSSIDLFSEILATLNGNGDLSEPLLCFAVETLLQLLESKTLVLLLSRDLVLRVDEAVRPYMKHESSRVRKAVFKSFGLFLKASRAIVANESADNSSVSISMKEILLELTVPERKLVEYFSGDYL